VHRECAETRFKGPGRAENGTGGGEKAGKKIGIQKRGEERSLPHKQLGEEGGFVGWADFCLASSLDANCTGKKAPGRRGGAGIIDLPFEVAHGNAAILNVWRRREYAMER
jgi:hypothetical protein